MGELRDLRLEGTQLAEGLEDDDSTGRSDVDAVLAPEGRDLNHPVARVHDRHRHAMHLVPQQQRRRALCEPVASFRVEARTVEVGGRAFRVNLTRLRG